MSEAKFHAHTKQLAELWFYIGFVCFNFYIPRQQVGKTKDSEPNGSKHSPNLVCP
jgi:hypothetical protein